MFALKLNTGRTGEEWGGRFVAPSRYTTDTCITHFVPDFTAYLGSPDTRPAGKAGEVDSLFQINTKDLNYKGYIHHANKDEPQYEIKSEKTAHIALHKSKAFSSNFNVLTTALDKASASVAFCCSDLPE